MPPKNSGLGLTADQRALVADWVRLGCPEAESNLPASCSPPPPPGGAGGSANPPPQGAGGTGPNPPPQSAGGTGATPPRGTGGASTNPGVTMISITRAEWDSEKASLRLEGACTDYSATLSAEFGGRTEPLTMDTGRFRNMFSNVATDPGMVTVTASTGVKTTSAVTAK